MQFNELTLAPSDIFYFTLSGEKWELRKDEEGFFKNGKNFSTKEFLKEAAPNLFRERVRLAPKDLSVFKKIGASLRSEIGILREQETLPEIQLTGEEKQELVGLAEALDLMVAASEKYPDIVRTWRIYRRAYGRENSLAAAFHFCCYGRPPGYSSVPLESNTAVEVFTTRVGIGVRAAGEVDFKKIVLSALAAALVYRKKSKEDFSEMSYRRIFGSRIYSAEGKRVSLTRETREALFKIFLDLPQDFLEKHSEEELPYYVDLPALVFQEEFEFFIRNEDWEESSYIVSEAALRQRRALADKKNWEKFCRDVLPLYEDGEMALSTQEVRAAAGGNYNSVMKWKKMGYLEEVPSLKKGKLTFLRCPLLDDGA